VHTICTICGFAAENALEFSEFQGWDVDIDEREDLSHQYYCTNVECPGVGNCYSEEQIRIRGVPLREIGVKKLRRRIEDRLRKLPCHNLLVEIAERLQVKILE